MKKIIFAILISLSALSYGQARLVHYSAMQADDVKEVRDNWFTNANNSLQVVIQANFGCASLPVVIDSNGPLKGVCTRYQGIHPHSVATYRKKLLYGPDDVLVTFPEYRFGLAYDVSFSEYGTAVTFLGYK